MKFNFALSVGLIILGSCNSKPGKPIIVFEKSKVDFRVKEGESKQIIFTFENKGTDSLEIKSIDADCGCTKVSYSKHKLAPDGRGIIYVTYDNLLDGRHLGSVKRYILVKSNTNPMLSILEANGLVKKESLK